jgi:hypothetical protein
MSCRCHKIYSFCPYMIDVIADILMKMVHMYSWNTLSSAHKPAHELPCQVDLIPCNITCIISECTSVSPEYHAAKERQYLTTLPLFISKYINDKFCLQDLDEIFTVSKVIFIALLQKHSTSTQSGVQGWRMQIKYGKKTKCLSYRFECTQKLFNGWNKLGPKPAETELHKMGHLEDGLLRLWRLDRRTDFEGSNPFPPLHRRRPPKFLRPCVWHPCFKGVFTRSDRFV